MDSNQNLLSSDLQVDAIAAAHLKETAMWAKLLAVVGLVLSILLGIFGVFAGTMVANMTRSFGDNTAANPISSGILTVVYLIIAGVYFFMSLFLFRFAVKMKQALLTSDQEQFNISLLNLKFVYRFMGIIMIIYLAFLVLAMIVGIGAAAFMK
ncbi:MAG: hypothetical protein ABI741_13155 [Ferruginibacter sp.]